MSEVLRVEAFRGEVVNEQVMGPGRALLPLPQLPTIRVREARLADLPFIDQLQKQHTKAVGWMPTGQLEGHIAKGHVLVAEAASAEWRVEGGGVRGTQCRVQSAECSGLRTETQQAFRTQSSAPSTQHSPIGYCIGVDKYFKREDTGIIYQMNIAPGRQRGLVGATLLKAMFERSAYGVKLFCCWCAQDLAANRFWEAMGFVALAFRTGSRKRSRNGRVHIFWQKRIREGDTQTAWWYPSQTGSGAIREDRIVLPIPPGVHWSEAKPRVLPGVSAEVQSAECKVQGGEGKVEGGEGKVEGGEGKVEGGEWRAEGLGHDDSRALPEPKRARVNPRKKAKAARATRPAEMNAGRLWFGGPQVESRDANPGLLGKSNRPRKPRKPQAAAKNDPRLVAAARELRDRWMEQVAAQPGLIAPRSGGGGAAVGGAKYEVSRQIGWDDITMRESMPGALPVLAGAGALAGVIDVQSRLLDAA
ncbi:MAG: hypothetical protein WD042_13090 [Phycisphaeraceae bacterium]